MTKEDMKQISDLMDEKFIASEGRMRAEIVASEARTGEKIDRVENNLSAEIKKNRISMTRHMHIWKMLIQQIACQSFSFLLHLVAYIQSVRS